MKNFQGLVQGQGLRQLPLRDIVQFQQLLRANVQDLSAVITQMLSTNLLFDGVNEIDSKTESLDSDLDPDFDQDIATMYSRSDDDVGYRMSGDGPAANDIPDDRKSYLSVAESLTEELERQIGTFNFSEAETLVAIYLVQSLDHNGFLSSYNNPVEYLVEQFELPGRLVDDTLAFIRANILPAGLFAENVRHSLMLQAERLPESVTKATLTKVLEDRYDDVISKNLNELKAYLRVDNFDIINDLYRALESFNPIPVASQGVSRAFKTRQDPDFIVREENGRFMARSTDKNLPEIRVNQGYSDTLATLHKERKFNDPVYAFLKNERREINKTIAMLRERQDRLEKVVSYVLNKQSEYLSKGDPERIRPLLEKDIAAEFGVNPSTVSRIATGKLIQTEEGRVVDLSELFSLGVQTRSGERAAVGQIKEKIRELVRNENHNKPMTSIELEKELKNFGFIVSSTHVRKMCEEMEIPDNKHRKVAYSKAREENSSIGDLMAKWNLKSAATVNDNITSGTKLKIKM